MKNDVLTSILIAIIGVVIAYFVTGFFIGEASKATFKVVNTKVEANLDEPDPEIFNYRAINPTVEVYVGCEEYNSEGKCIEKSSGQQEGQ